MGVNEKEKEVKEVNDFKITATWPQSPHNQTQRHLGEIYWQKKKEKACILYLCVQICVFNMQTKHNT